ncbi:MAG TPA: hypothetical protein VJ761_08950 [Ktedonobacteraceae bacterium]|nr:hypothetical protein [Ktedonobacteraceae bacterium]
MMQYQIKTKPWISDTPLLAFLFISLLLLTLYGCGGAGGTSGSPNGSPQELSTPCTGSSDIVSCSEQSNLRIDVGSAAQMQVQDSQVIKVVLSSVSGSSLNDIALKASVPAENATVTSTPTNLVGTPDVPLQNAFGPGYEPFATATLGPNPAFTFMPLGDTASEQPLNQDSITWRWSVIANKPGTQILDVNIEAMWKPLSKKFPKQQPASIGNAQIQIQVAEPMPTPTPTLSPSPTPDPVPSSSPITTVTPGSSSTPAPHSSNDPLSDVFALLGLVWTTCFGGKAFYETDLYKAIKNKTTASLRPPKPLTITNILLGIVIVLLIWIIFHPSIFPHV